MRYHDPFCSREGLTDRECAMCERLDEARKQERETIAVSIEAPEDDCWVCEGLRSRRCDQNKHCPLDDIAAFIRASES